MSFVFITVLLSGIIAIVSVVCVIYAIFYNPKSPLYRRRFDLIRHGDNPILSPQAHRDWEAEGSFNPGAVMDDEGKVHLFYRAIGRDGLSRIGHALAPDGKNIVGRSPYPVYEPQQGSGMPEKHEVAGPHHFDRSAHVSGGGWGGSEDPRVVRIGNRVYMTYTAFEGWSNMRIALTSISVDDLNHKRWSWKRPVLLSPKNSRAKNWVLFPEKIGGKFAILHAISPRIQIAYVDSPEMAPKVKSIGDHGGWGYSDKSREKFWDSSVRGAGAPPMKTDLGWLLLYHAIDKRNPHHVVGYKVGAMILDRDDPTRILYRSPEPILSPDMPYENDGKPGVVYASGAVIKDGKLFVYYGGGDKHTCVAETQLNPLLSWLTTYGKV